MMIFYVLVMVGALGFAGCSSGNAGNKGQLQSYPAPVIEAGWIRNGEPVVLQGQQWFPVRDVETLMDSDVYQIGEYKGVQIFVDKLDIKPYERIYTKFAKNKYRYFERAKDD
jgi:hypothetical protein